MTTRISERDLENVCKRINKATGNKEAAATWDENGKTIYNIGTYIFDAAYGGYQFQQIVSDGGSVRTISSGGYVPKRELYNQMQAFLAGIEAANN